MDCIHETNLSRCNCSYSSCDKKGKCCLCLSYHRRNGQLPACFFDQEYERTYDRSLGNFLKMVKERGMRTD